jgi:hypothetical protein
VYDHAVLDRIRGLKRLMRLLTGVVIAAGRAMASSRLDDLWAKVRATSFPETRLFRRIVANSLTSAPLESADDVIRWLCRDERRFHCGPNPMGVRSGRNPYSPARRLIRKFTVTCSEENRANLIEAILRYTPRFELKDFEYCHGANMGKNWHRTPFFRGYIYQRILFLGQYMLLSAVRRRYRPISVADHFGVLSRKFGRTAKIFTNDPRSRCGFVGSPIPNERIPLISDRQWLRIVRGDRKRGRRFNESRHPFMEMTPELFARNIGGQARNQPRQFVSLATKFPSDVDGRYISAILRQAAETEPPSVDEKSRGWTPASCFDIEAVVDRFSHRVADREIIDSMAWVALKRPSESWDTVFLSRIVEAAIHHPHPPVNEDTISTEDPIERHEFTSINCTRGLALLAIAELLSKSPSLLPIFIPAIESGSRDPHPAVRCAAVSVAVTLLFNCDQTLAMNTFLRSVDSTDDAILGHHSVDDFLGCALLQFWRQLVPALDRMRASTVEKVCKRGAAWMVGLWIHKKIPISAVNSIFHGSNAHREGAAEMLSHEIADGHNDPAVLEALCSFFDDPIDKVRNTAATVFRTGRVFASPVAAKILVDRLAASVCATESADDLIMGLKQAVGLVTPYADAIMLLLERLAEAREQARIYWIMGNLAEILLRLYEQCDADRALRRRCLDAWDIMVRTNSSVEILAKLDR